MKVFPGAAIETFNREKAMQAHVGEYKKAARNASGLFDQKMSAKGRIGEGEVGATYKEADERSYRAFQEMRKAYQGLVNKLKMKPEDAIKLMSLVLAPSNAKAVSVMLLSDRFFTVITNNLCLPDSYWTRRQLVLMVPGALPNLMRHFSSRLVPAPYLRDVSYS